MRLDIVYLIGVTSGENDHVFIQEVDVKPLEGGHTVATVELLVASGNWRILNHFFYVA